MKWKEVKAGSMPVGERTQRNEIWRCDSCGEYLDGEKLTERVVLNDKTAGWLCDCGHWTNWYLEKTDIVQPPTGPISAGDYYKLQKEIRPGKLEVLDKGIKVKKIDDDKYEFPKPDRSKKLEYFMVPVEELTKEELIDAIYLLNEDLERERKSHMDSLDILGR